MPSISISMTSPFFSHFGGAKHWPTPLGVPVAMISWEQESCLEKLILSCRRTFFIIYLVLESCRSSPFTKVKLRLPTSAICRHNARSHYGIAVGSCPYTIGRAAFAGLLMTDHLLWCSRIHTQGRPPRGYPGLPCLSLWPARIRSRYYHRDPFGLRCPRRGR